MRSQHHIGEFSLIELLVVITSLAEMCLSAFVRTTIKVQQVQSSEILRWMGHVLFKDANDTGKIHPSSWWRSLGHDRFGFTKLQCG